MISRRDIPGALLVLVFAAVAVADVGLQTTRLHAPVGRNITVLAQWNVTNSNSTDSLSSISVDLSHVGDGDALFCPESSEIRCDRPSTTKLDIAPSGASASLDSFQAALRSVLLFVGSLGTPQRSLSVTATAQSSASVSKTEIVWAHPVLRFDGSAPATLSFPDGNRTTFVLPSVLVEYFDGFNLSAAVTIERGRQGDRLSSPPSSLPSASACSVSPSPLSLGPCSASEMQAKLRLLAFDSCFGSGALRSVVVSLAPSETPGDSSALVQGITLLPVVPEFTVFRNGSEVVQYPVVATVGDIGPNSHVAVSLEYFLDHPGNVFCVAANRKDPFKEPTAYDLFNMAHDPQHNQPSRDYSSFGYGVIGATNATVRMMTGIQLGQDYAVFCCTAFDFVTLRGLSMNVTTRNATLPAARKSSDSSWTQTIIIVVCVVAGVICVERCYTSCRRVYRRRMGTEGFSEMPMVDSSAMDDDIDLSREVELAEREDRGRDGRPTADPDAWKTGNTFVSV